MPTRSELRIYEPPWNVILIRHWDATPTEAASAMPHGAWHVDRWFPEGPGEGLRSRTRLLWLCELLSEPWSMQSQPTHALRQHVKRALEQGRLLAIPVEPLRLARPAVGVTPTQPAAARAAVPEPEPRLTLHLSRLYHDNAPVQLAHFRVELDGGDTVEGQLDSSGTAVVPGLRATPRRVRFGPDERAYRLVDQAPNPAYEEGLDADALVARRFGGAGQTNGESS